MPRPSNAPPADPGPDAGNLPSGFLVGEYRIDRLLGRGGMGAVYAAVQPEIGARVAIKVLGAALSRDPRLVKRFVDEARVVNKIGHPNIIDVFAFGHLPDGRQYFVMEYLEGETLATRLERGPVPPGEARRLLQQICEALEAAHEEQVIHRDLKPENLWIATPRHGQAYAKVLDFGIAKLIATRDAPTATETGTVMGTPHFMSPEQCRGEAVDPRTDIYAMGVILYFMWSGRLPFEGSSFVEVASQQITSTPLPPSAHRAVPPRLERLIMSCLEKDPARRPASAKVLGREIGEAMAEMMPGKTAMPAGAVVGGAGFDETQASSGTRSGRPRAPLPHASRARFALAALLALMVSGGAFLILRARRDSSATRQPDPTQPAEWAQPAPQTRSASIDPPQVPPAAPASAALAPPPLAGPPPRRMLPPSVRAPRPNLSPSRPLDRVAPDPRAERPASRLEGQGFLRENPFR